VGTSIFTGTSVPSRNTSSSESKVYERKPRTTVDLKQNIREEVAAISPTVLQRVMQNFQKRLGGCADKDASSQILYSGSEYCN